MQGKRSLCSLQNPDREVVGVLSFSIFILNVIIWAFAIAFFRMSQTIRDALLWDRMIYLSGSIVPPMVFFFSHTLAYKRLPSKFLTIPLIIISAYFIVILYTTRLWVGNIILNNEGNSVVLGPVYIWWGIFLACVYNAGIWILVKKLIHSKSLERLQIQYVLIAALFPMVVGIIPNVIMPFFGNYRNIFIGPLVNIAMAIVISYAIIKHRLLDIHFLIARSVAYVLFTILACSFYAGGMFAISTFLFVQPADISYITFSTILAIIISFSFQSVLKFIEKITERIFYKNYYHIDEFLYAVSRVMATKLELSELMSGILSVIDKFLHVTCAMIIIQTKGHDDVIESSCSLEKHAMPTSEEIDLLKKRNQLLVYEDMDASTEKEIMSEYHMGLFMPIRTNQESLGCLLLGEKSSGDMYFSQDIKVLQIMLPELAVALENSQSYETIKTFNKTLKAEVDNATSDLRNANEHLKQLDSLKDEFISIASHELRTPLTTLKGFLELELKDPGKLSYDSRNHLERAYTSSQRMIALVNDMLDVSKIESDRITLAPVQFNLVELVQSVISEEEAHAKEKLADVHVVGDKTFRVTADPSRIHQILLNLINNALKFIPEKGTVIVTCSEKDSRIEVAISDNGPGIPKEGFPRLFTKFGKLGTSYSSMSETQGTGLGLYICKKLVELQNGKIFVTSEVGKGSTFTFTLPKVLPEVKKSGTLG